jgi:hypothetical protein
VCCHCLSSATSQPNAVTRTRAHRVTAHAQAHTRVVATHNNRRAVQLRSIPQHLCALSAHTATTAHRTCVVLLAAIIQLPSLTASSARARARTTATLHACSECTGGAGCVALCDADCDDDDDDDDVVGVSTVPSTLTRRSALERRRTSKISITPPFCEYECSAHYHEHTWLTCMPQASSIGAPHSTSDVHENADVGN